LVLSEANLSRSFNISCFYVFVGDKLADEKKTEIRLGAPLSFKLITDEGRFREVLLVPYMIGKHHYEVQVDKEGVTPESIEKAVREDAKLIVGSTGKIITI